MEGEPKVNTDNVHFIDEYPDLEKKVWLRRLHQQRLGQLALFPKDPGQLLLFRTENDPDNIA